MESWKDLLKQLWYEMNPVEGYTYDTINKVYKQNAYRQPIVDIRDAKTKVIYKNNVNDIIDATRMFKDKMYGDKIKYTHGTPKKVNLPNNYNDAFSRYPSLKSDLNREYYKMTLALDDDIKYINKNIDNVVNRIPTKTLGKIANKLMSYPIVDNSIKLLDKAAIPAMSLDILKLQGAYPYTEKEYKQLLNNMGIQYKNGQIQL